MKTFETEKGNIPEGATHYSDESESDIFAWFKSELGVNYLWCPGIEGEEYWIALTDQNEMYGEEVKPIPQTKGVGWVNGDEVVISKSSRSKWFVVGVSPVTDTSTICVSNTGELKSFHTNQLKKPETEAERVEREMLEVALRSAESPRQPEEFEWNNGDVVFIGDNEVGKFIGLNPTDSDVGFVYSARDHRASSYHLYHLSPQSRKERQRANAIYDMCASADNFTEESNFWAGKFYDLGYRKESE